MSLSETKIEIFDEFKTLDLDGFFAKDFETLIMIAGIDYSLGPTLNAWLLVGDIKAGKTVQLIHCKLDPFFQEIFNIGEITVGATMSISQILQELPMDEEVSCPTLSLVTKRIEKEKLPSLLAKFLSRFKDTRGVYSRVKEFFGNSLARVNKEASLEHENYMKKCRGEESDPGEDQEIDEEEAFGLANLLLDDRHRVSEFGAIFAAWVTKCEDFNDTLNLPTFQQLFFRMALSCHMPVISQDDEAEEKPDKVPEGDNCDSDQTLELISSPDDFATLSPERTKQVAITALENCLRPNSDDEFTSYVKGFCKIWPMIGKKVKVGVRLEWVAKLAKEILEGNGNISGGPLLPFILFEEDPNVVASATMEFAVFFATLNDDPLAGPKFILSLIEGGKLKNTPAVFAGLVSLGDQRVINLINPYRKNFDEEDLQILTSCDTGFLHAATVEFFLSWLEDLDEDYPESFFGILAAKLSMMVITAKLPMVLSIERVFPNTPGNGLRVLGQWTIADYAKRLDARLKTLAKKGVEEGFILKNVRQNWGI